MSSAVLFALWLAAHPTIASNSDCPSSRDIESHLSVLLPNDDVPSGTATISAAPNGLLVDLRAENRAFRAQRTVVVGGDCEERARAAAVVIATWWPVGTAGIERAETKPEVFVARESPRRFDVSAGGFASVGSDGVAPGARLEAAWLPWAQSFGFRLSVGGTGWQGGSLGQGQAHWMRAASEIGPTYSRGVLRLDGSVVASLFRIQGSGFTVDQTSTGVSVGASAGLRAGWAWNQWLPWLELRAIWWPQSQRIYVTDLGTGLQTTRPMPHAELQLGAGIALSLF